MIENTVTIVGNLTADPELKFTAKGAGVVKFSIASTPRVFDKATGGWVDGTPLFLNCELWRDAAENVAESLSRGSRVIATGKLKQESFETRAGEKRTVLVLAVEEIGPSLRYAVAKPEKAGRRGGTAPRPATGSFDLAAGQGFPDDEPPF